MIFYLANSARFTPKPHGALRKEACLRDAEDDEYVAEGGEDGQEDDGEAPVVGRRRRGGREGRRIEAKRKTGFTTCKHTTRVLQGETSSLLPRISMLRY